MSPIFSFGQSDQFVPLVLTGNSCFIIPPLTRKCEVGQYDDAGGMELDPNVPVGNVLGFRRLRNVSKGSCGPIGAQSARQEPFRCRTRSNNEYQDLNKAEQAVVDLRCSATSLCVVGDDDQSPYQARLVATATPQRRRLLNGQVHEFFAKYIMPYGPLLGRWYFTGKVFQESRRALRKLGMLSAMAAAARTVTRWLGRGYG